MVTMSRQRRGESQPGATPRVSRQSIIFRPERTEGSCALSGRTANVGTQNPGRCPGLAPGGTFSAKHVDLFDLGRFTVEMFSFLLRPDDWQVDSMERSHLYRSIPGKKG